MMLENVRVHELYFEGPSLPYVEVDTGEEILRIRVRRDSDALDWFRENQDKAMDLVISPKLWTACESSGVVNYFKCAVIRRDQGES